MRSNRMMPSQDGQRFLVEVGRVGSGNLTPVRNRRYHPYMETDMELTKKTTILLSPDLHAHLARTARARRTSLGQLVREACEIQYGHVSGEDRVRAVEALRRLSLPVGSPRKMKQESVPRPRDLRR